MHHLFNMYVEKCIGFKFDVTSMMRCHIAHTFQFDASSHIVIANVILLLY